MWQKLAHFLLKHRLIFLLLLLAATVIMGNFARRAEISYSFVKAIPLNNPKYVEYLNFQKKFGDDGNILVLGVQPKRLNDLNFIQAWFALDDEVKAIPGVENIFSLKESFYIKKDTAAHKLLLKPVFPSIPATQGEVDSLISLFRSLPIYKGLIYNDSLQSTLMAVQIKKTILDSKERNMVIDSIMIGVNAFTKATGLEVHETGLPFVRTIVATRVANELRLFLLLAIIITALVLLILLRSFYAVIFSVLVVGIAVIWSLGIIVLLGYKINLLTALMPPLVVVIAITNCVYLLNKYHIEYLRQGDKHKAIATVVERLGLATLFTNLTAAIGFGVFCLTKSQVLVEFGEVAGLSILGVFVISIILIPCIYSYMPAPNKRHLSYLNHKFLNKILSVFDHIVHKKRKWVYGVTILVAAVSVIGMIQLKATGYIVDDIPHKDKVYTDLLFFQNSFNGVFPLEIMVDTKKRGAVESLKTIDKISNLQDSLARFKELSRPLSIAEVIKFATQGFYDGSPADYRIPNSLEKNFILSYYANAKTKNSGLQKSFVDSNKQIARIIYNIADIGNDKMPPLFAKIHGIIISVFDSTKYKVSITGTSVIFLEGNRFIVNGLFESIILAFILIALCMAYLFRSFKMIFFCMVPNTIPLLFTAGLMGYLHIAIKPSTVLIFSVAFGIAVDNAIRFLAKYQQERKQSDLNQSDAVSRAVHEAGISIIYTSIILFFGFIIFIFSGFDGTVYLGLLTSITLVVAMFNNLLLLPSLLLSLERWDRNKELEKEVMIEV